MRTLLLVIAAVAALALPAAAPAQPAAEAQRDWTRTVVATPEGGFRMGNPDASLHIVEYVSLTCPHCARFARIGQPQLIDAYVRSGRASFEIRSFVLNPIDALAATLNRCAAPERYFAMNDEILAEQEAWFGRLMALSEAELDAVDALPQAEQVMRYAELSQLAAIAARHGIGSEAARACLADRAGSEALARLGAEAEALGVSGTPSFLVNGVLARGVHEWRALEPLLRQAR